VNLFFCGAHLTITDQELRIHFFCHRTPDAGKKVTPALRGVLAEIATTGIIRSAAKHSILARTAFLLASYDIIAI
jgi:hypothetical protein